MSVSTIISNFGIITSFQGQKFATKCKNPWILTIYLCMINQIFMRIHLDSCNSPVSQYERPRAVALTSSACVAKTTKIITEFTRKDPFLHLKRANLVLQQVLLWSKVICVACKLLMSVYLDIKSLYPHLKVNWNVLMCKICIARHLVVDNFLWCNANFVPFPSGTLVAHRMWNGSILLMRIFVRMDSWILAEFLTLLFFNRISHLHV